MGLGATGGVVGFTSAMLITAGTGGFAPAILAGFAGVISTTLGTYDKGPLATAEFKQIRDGTKQIIDSQMAGFTKATDANGYRKIATSLEATCFSAVKGS
ncbi:hypothetical protein [Pseudomonas fluorescens]|uniref:hypothetical protein n=1 Tax=Pseudomonas fluorescens TaxID=294 RepID=UPI00124064A3|nr:hypothetical protein [Pseudomonas fluorescens]